MSSGPLGPMLTFNEIPMVEVLKGTGCRQRYLRINHLITFVGLHFHFLELRSAAIGEKSVNVAFRVHALYMVHTFLMLIYRTFFENISKTFLLT